MFELTFATVLAFAQPRDGADVRKRELLSSVAISGTCARGCSGKQRMFGTGEIVARRSDGTLVVLTARHVVEDMGAPRVYIRDGALEGTRIAAAIRDDRGSAARVIAQSPDVDLALVTFRPARDDTFEVATFASDGLLESGNVVGGPYGALWTVSPYRAIPAGDDAELVSCETCGPGDSGGGVFDGGGRLAGILVSQQVMVDGNEPAARAKRSSRFKIVPLGDVRTFVASVTPDIANAPVATNDPWSRFARNPASRAAGARDPWSRFETRGDAPP